MILIATTDYNREQNREAKTQEKEMKKAFSHVQMIAALQRHTLKSIKALKVNQVGNAGFAQSLGIVPKIVWNGSDHLKESSPIVINRKIWGTFVHWVLGQRWTQRQNAGPKGLKQPTPADPSLEECSHGTGDKRTKESGR